MKSEIKYGTGNFVGFYTEKEREVFIRFFHRLVGNQIKIKTHEVSNLHEGAQLEYQVYTENPEDYETVQAFMYFFRWGMTVGRKDLDKL